MAGVGFSYTKFPLNIPEEYDVPLSFVFINTSISADNKRPTDFRCQLSVNGY